MRSYLLWIACLTAAAFSCTDQGNIPNYLEVTEVYPAPNSTGVDKAALVSVFFDRDLSVHEAGKIQLRYVDDTNPITSSTGCSYEVVPPVDQRLCVGPYIWKPGKTVEVTIPKEIADPEGNTLRQSIVYRFTTAQDTAPFDLIGTLPVQNDTISLSEHFYSVYGLLTFNDYVSFRDSGLTIEPRATLRMGPFMSVGGRVGPFRQAQFEVTDLQANTTYTITIPRTIKDYEGQALPRDYHIVFHTKP